MTNLLCYYSEDYNTIVISNLDEQKLVNQYPHYYTEVIYFFATLSPANESTWSNPNFMKAEPQCRAVTHHLTQCPNNSTPSHDLFCRIHILHPPRRICVDGGITEPNPEYPGRK